MNCFKSNGKFLLTGEYLVLKGATALALPLRLGQSMNVETLDSDEGKIYWDAYIKSTRQQVTKTTSRDASMIPMKSTNIDTSEQVNETTNWFSVVLDKNDFSVKENDDFEKAKRLSDILSKAKSLNENIFNDSHDYRFSTYLDFNPQWGLGSSSTLINNISEWADINPYQLLEMTFKGSGYDIACAKANGAIFYRVNESRAADFNPSFKDNLYFVYQGHKQNSANEVKAFLDKEKSYDDEVMKISEISETICHVDDYNSFCNLIKSHEEIMERVLNRKRIKSYYPDFEGEMKSLGAWGGDFFLVATEWDEDKVRKYFTNKGLDVIFRYNDIVLSR